MIGSAAACAAWGYFLYQGVVDPFGGIWTLWPLFGASNQMLAAIALILCTVVMFRMKRENSPGSPSFRRRGWSSAR